MADKATVDRIMEQATREFQKDHPGVTQSPEQTAAQRKSIEDALAKNAQTSSTASSVFSTTMTTASYAADGSTLFYVGNMAKTNLGGGSYSYGYDIGTNVSKINAASRSLITGGERAGAALVVAKSGLKLVGAAAIPITIAMGAYETIHSANAGDRRGAYQAGVGTAVSLGASIAAGAAVGTMVTPLVGTAIGAVVGVGTYYLGRYLGGAYADATDPKKDFNAVSKNTAGYAPSRMSVSFDPSVFKNAPASQTAFSGAVKPAGIDVTKVAEANTKASNEASYKKSVVTFNYS